MLLMSQKETDRITVGERAAQRELKMNEAARLLQLSDRQLRRLVRRPQGQSQEQPRAQGGGLGGERPGGELP